MFNLDTYKYHSLGDYVEHIKRYGTTDSYSTEAVSDSDSQLSCYPVFNLLQGELEHRTPKMRYKRTDRKQFVKQLAQIERREARIHRLRMHQSGDHPTGEEECTVSPDVHHTIGQTENFPEHAGLFVQRHSGDPAVEVCACISKMSFTEVKFFQGFIPKLKQHLLPRIRAKLAEANECFLNGSLHNDDSTGPPGDWQAVVLKQDRFYKHNIMRVNYTTYDVRREEDTIHAGMSHCNIMMLNPAFAQDPSQHPFCYAHVLGIFHANIVYLGEHNVDYCPRRLEFLWVRWYDVERHVRSGWKTFKLDRVHFPPMANNMEAFGFLDPADVLRGCHVIPAFSARKVHPDGRLLSSLAQDQNDWRSYYINR